jgi:hypothetical protein
VICVPKDTQLHPKDFYRRRKDFDTISEAIKAANPESRERVKNILTPLIFSLTVLTTRHHDTTSLHVTLDMTLTIFQYAHAPHAIRTRTARNTHDLIHSIHAYSYYSPSLFYPLFRLYFISYLISSFLFQIYIAPGTYKESLEITVPVDIIGEGPIGSGKHLPLSYLLYLQGCLCNM